MIHPVLVEAQRWDVSVVKVPPSFYGRVVCHYRHKGAEHHRGFSALGSTLFVLSSGEAIIEVHLLPSDIGRALEGPPRHQTRRLIAQQLMHEIAHVVVGVSPSSIDESLALAAVEHEALTRLGLWRGWSELPTRSDFERRLDLAYADAIRKGLMTEQRKPTYQKRLFRRRYQ